MERFIKPSRLFIFALLLIAILSVYGVTLYRLQIIEGAAYYERSQNSIVTEQTVTAARGNILDRYGRVLVSNRSCNNILIDSVSLFKQEDPNAVILEIVDYVEECGDTYQDTLPITMEAPFEYIENMTDLQQYMLEEYIKSNISNGMPENPSAVEVMAFMRSRYKIDDSYDNVQTRIIAGIRYEVNVRYVVNTSDYIFAEDVSINLITKLMENDVPGFTVSTSYVREYNTEFAAHILGYIGQMDAIEYEETYKEMDNYEYNALVGKEGAELKFEEYLHGVDGQATVTSTSTGTVTNTEYTKEPEPGNHIYLTIDIGLQEVAELTLAAAIAEVNASRDIEGGDAPAEGGAIVVVDIDSGEPLALASYPTYNLETFLEDYDELLETDYDPLFNRALMGTYPPGSTFKMVTALAALQEGKITLETTIYDEGIFSEYADAGYAPTCWIYPRGSHGDVNVVTGIKVSCNYFFYTLGNYLGIDLMAKYAAMFGLGEATGIELPELNGVMPTSEYKRENQEALGLEEYLDWYSGDNLSAAIGQSYLQFTPLQIANYVATIANGGTRYSASVLKSVRSYDYSEQVLSRHAEILNVVEGDEEYFEALQQGMRAVVTEGTAATNFAGYSIDVAAKTGTAERGESTPNNAVFVCYAPYDDPQIAVAVVIEKGGSGSSLVNVAKEVLNYYFSFQESIATLESEMTLLK